MVNKEVQLEEDEEKTPLDDLGGSSQLSGDNREAETAAVEDGESTKPEATTQGGEEKRSGEEETEYPTGLPLMIVVVGLCLAILLVALVS
jgi:hypothetical protein